MAVEEGIVLLRDVLLVIYDDEYLPNIKAASDDLHAHEWKIDCVTMVENLVNFHSNVHRLLEAEVVDCKYKLY